MGFNIITPTAYGVPGVNRKKLWDKLYISNILKHSNNTWNDTNAVNDTNKYAAGT